MSNLSTVLLVEDSCDDYEAAIRSFKAAHFENPVHWCKSGVEALAYLRAGGPVPALVLLDLNMPGMDGREVLAIAKRDPLLRKIPFIILTTSSNPQDISGCYDLGASTYIQKPVGFDGLVNAAVLIKEYWFSFALLPEKGQ